MYRKSLLFLLIALLLTPFLGCKKAEDRVVATVGNIDITVRELEKQYVPTELGTPEEMMQKKREALDILIKERLQLNEAEERGYEQNEDLVKMLDERKRVLVVNQLYKVEIVDRVKLSATETRDAYQMLAEELDLNHILVPTEEEVRALHDSLKAGADFEELARNHSADERTRDSGGSMGWVRWGGIPSTLAEPAYTLKEGQFSDPIGDNAGWHLLKLDGRRSVENVRPFEEEQKRIESRLKQNKMKEMADTYLNNTKERIAITYNEDVVKTVAEKAPKERISPWAPAPLPEVTDSEREMVLVTTSKGEWTVGKILDLAAKVPPRTAVGTPEGLKQWVDMLILQEELVEEALRKRLDKTPEVRDELRHLYMIHMVNLLHREEVDMKSNPTEEETKAEYETNKDKYAEPEKNWVSIIVTATEEQATEVLKSLKKGADFEAVAKEKSIHPTKARGGNLGLIHENRQPEIFNIATKLRVGLLSEPASTPDGWTIIKVTKREEKKMRSYDDAKRLVERDLKFANQARLTDELLAQLREKFPVTVNESVLEQAGGEKEEELRKKEEEKQEAS